MTVDLVAFLSARLDEDERVARACDGHAAFDGSGIVPGATARGPVMSVLPSHVAIHIARHDPARVLDEVDAKRRIIDMCADVALRIGEPERSAHAIITLHLLALPYAEHLDYREKWRP